MYRWYVVCLLLMIFILSYLDRYIPTLLIEPIKKSMGLSDFQVGLLLGPAFSLFHVLVGIPLGWYADRANRKYLLIAGIVTWCAMTVGSGLVNTFILLLLFRLGLGIGEAVVSPSAVSIISDYFDRKDRARAISLFMAGPYLGAGLAFLGGGMLVRWLETLGPIQFPLLGPMEPWHMAFVLVGLPGFLFAALMLTVREPERQEKLARQQNFGAAFVYIAKRWRAFGGLFIGSSCNFAISTLAFWNIPLFQRIWGWNVAEIGAVTGLFYFTAGPIGTALAVWAQRKFAQNHVDGSMRVLILGLLIGVPASALYPIMPSAEFAVVLMFVAFIGKSVATAGGPSSMALITPGEIRGQSLAIYSTVIALIGPLFGPPLVGWAIDASGDPKSIGIMLFGFVTLIGLPSILLIWLGLKHYRTEVQTLERTLALEPDASRPA
ncbi:MFS transporter [Sphingomonas sp. AOB5]|uniref:MFS transporter n=1 Tax=Sphingomonas sp. AOB5 TaxID=3034017 RepID=UPI0023F7EFD1|nr:MFS transporter [Sphingomonas sp. AOB5]MDF7775538.1 MFS transporter [Sphingomonas sp. AOB5]